MKTFFKKIWQVWFYQWSLPLKLASVGIVIALILAFWLFFRMTRKPEVKIDESQLQKINSETDARRRQELEKIIEQNAEAVKTVDNRSTIAETNVIERNRKIDEAVREADKKIQEAKSSGRDVSSAELECILTGDCQ